jgi:hypothetical protein
LLTTFPSDGTHSDPTESKAGETLSSSQSRTFATEALEPSLTQSRLQYAYAVGSKVVLNTQVSVWYSAHRRQKPTHNDPYESETGMKQSSSSSFSSRAIEADTQASEPSLTQSRRQCANASGSKVVLCIQVSVRSTARQRRVITHNDPYESDTGIKRTSSSSPRKALDGRTSPLAALGSRSSVCSVHPSLAAATPAEATVIVRRERSGAIEGCETREAGAMLFERIVDIIVVGVVSSSEMRGNAG